MAQARSVLKNSHSPYSNFRVGAAIASSDGTIFVGTNVENVSYGLTICAERAAIFAAVSKGHKSFTDLAIASSSGKPAFPCGACRQVLAEFSPNIRIHLENSDKSYSLTELLPNSFKEDQIVTHSE